MGQILLCEMKCLFVVAEVDHRDQSADRIVSADCGISAAIRCLCRNKAFTGVNLDLIIRIIFFEIGLTVGMIIFQILCTAVVQYPRCLLVWNGNPARANS